MYKVIFKENNQPCIQYSVKDNTEVMHYDEHLKKYTPCIDIEMLGLIPEELLTEATHPDNINATDISVYLTNNK